MNRKHTLLAGGAFGAVMLASAAASAGPIFIDGIGIAPGAQFAISTVYENQVTTAGQMLTGIGYINQIVSTNCAPNPGNSCWQNGQNGRELTFTFSYKLQAIAMIGGGQAQALFSDGIINFYSDSTPDFTPSSGNQAADFASASDGNLWLSLKGGATGDACNIGATICLDGAATPVTLNATFAAAGNLSVNGAGNGHGYLDVDTLMGGLAAALFDTNAQLLGHDFTLDTSFNNVIPTDFPISGSATLKTFVNAVPEPASMSLLGAGMLVLGFGANRRRKTA